MAPKKSNDSREEKDVRSPVVLNRDNSLALSEDDDSENTIPSPNISDFTIKPISNRDRPPLTPDSILMKMKKKKKKRKREEEEQERVVAGEEALIVVLGLPCPSQGAILAQKRSSNRNRVRSEVNVKRTLLGKGKEMQLYKREDTKSKELTKKLLEIYLKGNELVQRQTRLLLEELKSG